MTIAKAAISGQLRVGDDELPTYRIADILARIDAAIKLAGLSRVLYNPSANRDIDEAVRNHCRKRGVEVYLWYKILFDNSIIPEPGEQPIDAFGNRGAGESGLWRPLFNSEEVFVFACPQNRHYNRMVLNRCRQQMKEYDGLFVDNTGFALPSMGLESLFACFCPSCIEREPRLLQWRQAILEMRDRMVSSSDGDLEKWGNFFGLAKTFGLDAFFIHRSRLITRLLEQYASTARELGKGFGIDVLSPALADLAGHDLSALSSLADWVKPRIYCHTYGPSSIPLEYNCFAIGANSWAKRVSTPALMRFIGQSIGIDMPDTMHKLTESYLPAAAARREIDKAMAKTGGRVVPGIECSLHPDYDTGLDESTVRAYLTAARGCPGVVLCWNMLFIPDEFLRIVGEELA